MPAKRVSGVLCSVLAALLISSANSSAQSSPSRLTVRLTDPTGEPVAGARVIVSSRDARVEFSRTTDEAGTARFDALPVGEYVLDIEAAGFVRVTRPIVASPEEAMVAIPLAVAGVTERVVVTASGHLQTAAEVSKAVTVVDGSEIEARNEFSLADALRTVPGATVQQLGGAGAFTSIKLRGLRERDTAVLIDGVPFRDAAAPQGDATGFLGELYVAGLDRIEVLRGSGSSLYGSHAVGGAVNLITRGGSGPSRGEVAAEIGGLGFSRARAQAGGGVLGDRVTYSAGAAHTRTTRGVDGDDDARGTTIAGRSDVRLPASARATVRVHASDAATDLNESPSAIGPLPSTGFVRAAAATFIPSANDPDSTRDSQFASTLVRLEQRPLPGVGYTVTFHHLTTDRIFRDGPLGVSAFEPATENRSQFDGRVGTLGGRIDRDWSARHVTTLGYDFERERYVSRSVPVNALLSWEADITQSSHGLFIQQEMRLTHVQLAASVRAQRFGLHRAAFAPPDRAPFAAASFAAPPDALTGDVAAARWIAGTGTKLRAHAGNAYRAPAMFERAGVSFGSRGYTVFGNPNLGPERAVSVDAGIDQTLVRDRARLSATWFHTRLTSVIAFESLDPVADPFGRTSGYRTADGRTARGIELGARVQPSNGFQASIAYTFADSEPPVGSRDGLPRAAAVAAHQFSALVIQRIGRLQLALDVEAAGDHYVTLFDPVSFGARAYQFDGLLKADLTAGYTVARGRVTTRLFGTLDNMFDRSYFVQGFQSAGRTGRGGLAVAF